MTAPAPRPAQPIADAAIRIARLLDLAFTRPCFICHQSGRCAHREPEVELALLGVRW